MIEPAKRKRKQWGPAGREVNLAYFLIVHYFTLQSVLIWTFNYMVFLLVASEHSAWSQCSFSNWPVPATYSSVLAWRISVDRGTWRATVHGVAKSDTMEQLSTAQCAIVKVKLLSRVRFFVTAWTVAYQAPPSMEFSRQEYWSGLSFPSPGDLPNPGIEPGSPALQADTLPSEPPGKPNTSC